MKPKSSQDLEERAVLDLTDQVLRNDKTFSMSQIFQEIEYLMVKQTMYYRAMLVSVCVCEFRYMVCVRLLKQHVHYSNYKRGVGETLDHSPLSPLLPSLILLAAYQRLFCLKRRRRRKRNVLILFH